MHFNILNGLKTLLFSGNKKLSIKYWHTLNKKMTKNKVQYKMCHVSLNMPLVSTAMWFHYVENTTHQ